MHLNQDRVLIGLDIGTTGCKAVMVNQDGTFIARASREYSVDVPQLNWAEQDAERVWSLAQGVLREVVSGRQVTGAISLSVQGEAIIAVDEAGHALRPAILGMDTRTNAQNDWLRDHLGSRELFDLTGMPIHTINTLPKLLWIKQHEPKLWKSAAQFLLYEDFLIKKLTGKAVVSECLASRTQLFDTSSGNWSSVILSTIELEPNRLALIARSGTAVGYMHLELSEAIGFSKPPLIVTGGHDQACGALGTGLIEPGLAMVSTGTAEVVEVVLAKPPILNDTLYDGNISVYRHVVPDLYLAMTLNHSGGMLLRWFRDVFCLEEKAQAQRDQHDAYDIILQGASLEPSPLFVLPHFAGSGTPTFDTASKGAILGLTFGTTKADLAKALLEGLTFELRTNLDLLKRGGIPIDELRAIGGGARSPLWIQLKADITGIPVAVSAITEAAGLGAALLAGEGLGCYASAAQAVRQWTHLHLERKAFPDAERQERYAKRYALYQQIYPVLAPLAHQL